jgi:ABC-type phosphate transport system substrate-binding protein
MRMLSKLLAGVAVAATTIALTAGPALADPPGKTVPRPTDAVSVGANTTQYLFDQISKQYNTANPSATTKFYSWDATNPVTGAIGDEIETKSNCADIARPDGGGAGITALEANTADPKSPGNYCIDYARTASARTSSEPACASGGICFVSMAGDAVTWADRSAAAGGTDAPASLTSAQLAKIYECTDTNWDQVGGQNAPIEAFLPQTSAATRTFWLTALGGGTTPITPGNCVIDGTTSDPNSLEENEGVNPLLNTPEGIFIYSVGDYISQVYHSAACINSDCSPNSSNVVCTPKKAQNKFGCNESGVLQLGAIGSGSTSKPTTPWPLTPTSKNVKINANFSILFQRTLSEVVRYDPNTADHIPGGESGSPGGINLEQFFGASGYLCTNSSAQKEIKDYGFLSSWKLSTCGAVS